MEIFALHGFVIILISRTVWKSKLFAVLCLLQSLEFPAQPKDRHETRPEAEWIRCSFR